MTTSPHFTPYHHLLQGLTDLIDSGRLTEADLPDDFRWLTTQLTELAQLNTQSVFAVSDEARNTLLAALRLYQRSGYGSHTTQPEWLRELATNCQTQTPLDDQGIDLLCEKLNGA